MTGLERAAARMICVGFDGLTVPASLAELIGRGVRAVVLLGRNYQDPDQLSSLCSEIKSLTDEPVLICIDQEGGRVQRLGPPFTILPAMREIGLRGDVEEARALGRLMARELRAVHIDMNLAPVLDVDSNPANPVIGERSFGADPQLVADMGCALIEGLQSEGVAACGKHFPGHGDTSVDSHFELPVLDHDRARLERIELAPFAAAIQTGVAAIMTSHILFRALDRKVPATMSRPIIEGLLRNHLGFDGVVVSDDLEMSAIADHFGIDQAVVRGAAAGVDLFLICHRTERQHAALDTLTRAIAEGALPWTQVEQGKRRLDELMARFVRSGDPAER